jgi:hypothetical protein
MMVFLLLKTIFSNRMCETGPNVSSGKFDADFGREEELLNGSCMATSSHGVSTL